VVAVLVGVALVVVLVSRDDDPEAAEPGAARAPELVESVAAAHIQVDGVSDDDVAALIEELCADRDADAVAARIVELDVDGPDQVLLVVEGLGTGAGRYCPEVAASDPQLINEVYNATLEQADDG
jgi:hypothetical protein